MIRIYFIFAFLFAYYFMSHKYKHIFFDLDHTLWDFETNAALTLKDIYIQFNLKEKGVDDFNNFYKKYSHYNNLLWDKYTKGIIKQEVLRWKRMWLSLLEYNIGDQVLAKAMSDVFVENLTTKVHLFPYTIEILKYLSSKNYILHIISNGFEKTQISKLRNTQILAYFSSIITSEKSNSLKPHIDIFNYALKTTNGNKENSIIIGDNLQADIIGAVNAGIDCIYINHLDQQKSDIANYTIFHLKELENIL